MNNSQGKRAEIPQERDLSPTILFCPVLQQAAGPCSSVFRLQKLHIGVAQGACRRADIHLQPLGRGRADDGTSLCCGK